MTSTQETMTTAHFAGIGQVVVMMAGVDRVLGKLVATLLQVPVAPTEMVMDAVDISKKLSLLTALRGGHFKFLRSDIKGIEDDTRALIDARNTLAHGSIRRLEDGRWVARSTSPNKVLRFSPGDQVDLAELPTLAAKAASLYQRILALTQQIELARSAPKAAGGTGPTREAKIPEG